MRGATHKSAPSSHEAALTVQAFLSQAEMELRKPLALIQGYIETMRSGMVKGGEQLGRCLEIMDKHSRRLMHVVEDMNAVARMQPTREDLICDEFFMRRCIEVAVEQLTPELEARGTVIEPIVPKGKCRMKISRDLWHLLIVKLLEAMVRGRSSMLHIRLEVKWSNASVLLSVCKSPQGQSIDCQENQFTSTVERTFGDLELLVARRAVEVHDGSFELRPCGDECDCIILTLPCS